MAASFHRTLAAIRTDRRRAPVWALSIAFAILGGWIAWALAAEVSVARTSTRARLEVLPAPTRVAAPVAGRVNVVHLQVGAEAAAGDLLVELDATDERIAATKARARATALAPELESIERELVAEDDARLHAGSAELGAEGEVVARLRATQAELALARKELARETELSANGLSPGAERDRALAIVQRRGAELQALQHEAQAIGASHRERGDDRRAHRERLLRQRTELADELAAARADVERLEHEVERRTIRAPVAGTLGEVSGVRPGAVLQAGDVVATVVPRGQLHIVAEYEASVLGRLAVGQPARLRVDGFVWTRYGTIGARVVRVASELRDGTIRVELELTECSSIPVRHGMTGVVDVEIERISPFELLLRTIGDRPDGARAP
jgi:membrane fusion protein (multidrug efflux system)